MGGYAERVEHPDDIIPAIKRALQAMTTGKPALLDVITKLEWSSKPRTPTQIIPFLFFQKLIETLNYKDF